LVALLSTLVMLCFQGQQTGAAAHHPMLAIPIFADHGRQGGPEVNSKK
jgi:hypothetical protein